MGDAVATSAVEMMTLFLDDARPAFAVEAGIIEVRLGGSYGFIDVVGHVGALRFDDFLVMIEVVDAAAGFGVGEQSGVAIVGDIDDRFVEAGGIDGDGGGLVHDDVGVIHGFGEAIHVFTGGVP